MRLILASASPRRRDLLAQIGLAPALTVAAEIDETPGKGEAIPAYARRVALDKARKVAMAHGGPDTVVLAADTVVSAGRRILGKPASRDEAGGFLRLLSGRRHRVTTAVAVLAPGGEACRDIVTVLRFRNLSAAEIAAYLDSGEWQGKAGGYAIQGRAGAFVPWLQGSYSAVVGLPLAETAQMLARFGVRAVP